MLSLNLVAVLATTLSVTAAETPPVFTDLGFEQAVERARTEKRVVILDAMTSWCGPCKQMDATTWVDPRVERWVAEHGLAIQLDMDEHEALKDKLDITAFPTIVLLRDGNEFDRVVGFRNADELLTWFGASSEGKTAKDLALEKLAAARRISARDEAWKTRSHLVADLMWFGLDAEALVEFEWLWRHIGDVAPEQRWQTRWSRHRYAMRELADRHAPARPKFGELRALIQPSVDDGSADTRTIRDWIELNYVLNEERKTGEWADGQGRSRAGVIRLQSLQWRLFDLLIQQDRWRTAGLSLGDVVAEVRQKRADITAYDRVAEAGSKRSMPAIPMGGMQPAKRVDPRQADEESAEKKPETLPAIPLGGMKPAKRTEPSDDDAPKEPEKDESDKPKTLPAIPLGGMQPAKKTADEDAQDEKSEEPKTMPAIPLGGMRPAKKADGDGGSMMPAIPMGSPSSAAAKTREGSGMTVEEEVRWRLSEQFRWQASDRYGALLAADRAQEADAVARILLTELNDARSRARLVETTIRAGQLESARTQVLRWLEEISQDTSL